MKLFVFPGNIEDDILAIGAQQLPYMRTPFFSQIVKESQEMILSLMGCPKGRAIFLTASGTGAMDAVVANYVSTKSKAFIIVGGSFGKRWEDLCTYYNLAHVVSNVEFGKDLDYIKLEEDLSREKPEVLLCQQHETSSGQCFDVKRIGDLCKKYNVSLVVDVISSFLADPLSMDEFGIDICITSSQKGLNILPGISVIALSERLIDYPFASTNYYFDFKENLKNLTRGQTPYSPATSLFLQMHERLVRMSKEGLGNIITSIRSRALFFRELCQQNGWPSLAENPSNCITGFLLPKNGDVLFSKLMDRGFTIMPGGVPNYFRVSHLGVQSKEDLISLAHAIKAIETENND